VQEASSYDHVDTRIFATVNRNNACPGTRSRRGRWSLPSQGGGSKTCPQPKLHAMRDPNLVEWTPHGIRPAKKGQGYRQQIERLGHYQKAHKSGVTGS